METACLMKHILWCNLGEAVPQSSLLPTVYWMHATLFSLEQTSNMNDDVRNISGIWLNVSKWERLPIYSIWWLDSSTMAFTFFHWNLCIFSSGVILQGLCVRHFCPFGLLTPRGIARKTCWWKNENITRFLLRVLARLRKIILHGSCNQFPFYGKHAHGCNYTRCPWGQAFSGAQSPRPADNVIAVLMVMPLLRRSRMAFAAPRLCGNLNFLIPEQFHPTNGWAHLQQRKNLRPWWFEDKANPACPLHEWWHSELNI